MKWTDQRAKLILEILGMYRENFPVFRILFNRVTLGAMRVVKYFSYELPFLKRTFISYV